jgi:hypothetical protein
MSVLVGCTPVQWVGGARTVGLLEQRATASPLLLCCRGW